MPKRAADKETILALEESREWLRVTLASIGDAVITTNADGRVEFLNPIAETLTGWTQEQAHAQSLEQVFNIVNEDTRVPVENPALRALREGIVVGLANHTVLIHRDGTERPIDDSAAPIRNARGEVAGAILVFRDISERRARERHIAGALDYSQNILNTLRHPFLVLDNQFRIVSANRAFFNTFHVSREQIDGQLLFELGKGQWDIARLREMLGELVASNTTFENFEVAHDFPGIGPKAMALNARRVQRPGNGSELILLVVEDITDRKGAERRMHQSEVRYRRLFQKAKDGILILDAATGKIIDANAFMAGLLGMEAKDLLGMELHEIGLFKDVEANKHAVRELQRTGYFRHEHLPLVNRRGESVEVEIIANVYEEDGHRVAQCNVRDISERVAMEQKIQRQTEQLANESRRKDEFLAMLSHELRNPLAPIRSAVYLLKLQERGPENLIQRQAYEIIDRQVASMTKIISDLLEVSRVVSGRIRLNLQIVDLNQILHHAVETAMPLFEQRGHTLLLNLCPDPAWTSADATRMEEVFVNILNNAAKYTPDGGEIEIFCAHPRGKNYVEVRVLDNGVGIEELLLPGIFDLFTQADRSLNRAAGGLGIGLSLVHRLVDLHGGTVEAQSPPENREVGAEFRVRLPMAAPPQTAPEPEAVETVHPQGVRVLIVDDNIDMVTMLASTLRHTGHTVQTAYTGPDGLKTACQWRPDVLVLDIGLPGLDGYEVARRIHTDPKLAGMRIVALTGYGREVDIALAREAGFDAHMVKPYEFTALEKLMFPAEK